MSEETETLTIENSGDHHLAKATLDPKTGEINAGVITNFSENSSAGIQFVNGQVEGTFVHTGDNHALQLNAKGDGTYNGNYRDASGKVEIHFDGSAAKLIKGEIPATGVIVNGDNHRTTLSLSEDGKLQGAIESLDSGNGSFKIELRDGKPSGSFIHKGDGHTTEVGITADGKIKASVTAGAFSFGVEKGKAKATAFGKLNFKF